MTLANCDVTEGVAAHVAKALEVNSALKTLTLDSNSLSGETVVRLIKATAKTRTLEELRVTNQVGAKGQIQRLHVLTPTRAVPVELQILGQPDRD